MRTLRTRFKKEIVAEFLPPRRPSNRVIILCTGMPGVPCRSDLVDFFSRKGFWTFYPRYRGSWESGGRFLRVSPEQDVLDLIGALPRGFRDLWSGRRYRVRPQALYVLGSSFGGPAAILSSRHPRVAKAVALSPVVDWRVPSRAEPMGKLGRFVQEAYGGAYRFSLRDWTRLSRGAIYNPASHTHEIDGRKLLLIHAKDDKVVPWRPTARFARTVGATPWFLARGGHLSSANLMKPRFYRRVAQFLRS